MIERIKYMVGSMNSLNAQAQFKASELPDPVLVNKFDLVAQAIADVQIYLESKKAGFNSPILDKQDGENHEATQSPAAADRG